MRRTSSPSFTARAIDTAPTSVDNAAMAFIRLGLPLSLSRTVDQEGKLTGSWTASRTPDRDGALTVGDRPPFADTRAALRALRRRFRLATISNTDDDLFARTDQLLDVAFDRSPEKQSPQDLEILGAV
jgi:hypothetical protein